MQIRQNCIHTLRFLAFAGNLFCQTDICIYVFSFVKVWFFPKRYGRIGVKVVLYKNLEIAYEKRKQMAFFLERIPQGTEVFQVAVFFETELQETSKNLKSN